MQKKRIFAMATPTLGKVSMPWHMAVMNLLWPLNCTKTVIPCYDMHGGEIAEARDKLVDLAFGLCSDKQEVTHLFFLDDDVIVPQFCLRKLLNHNVPVASGVYFTKTEVGEPLIFPGPGLGSQPFEPDAVFEGWGWSMGLSVIRMDVFRRMRDELNLPLDKYGCTQFFKTPSEADTDYQDGIITDGGTEDFIFFSNLAKLGIKPVIDCTRYCMGFHMDMSTLQAYPSEQWKQYNRGEPVVWNVGGKETRWEQGVQRNSTPADSPVSAQEPSNASQVTSAA
jgi:hypothetical protein